MALLCAAFAQKKPITLENLSEASRGGGAVGARPLPSLWMPDGSRFLYRQSGSLMVYDTAAKTSKLLINLAGINAAAAARPAGGEQPFEWQNRNAGRSGTEFSRDGKELLHTSQGDLFVIHPDSGAWEQLTKTPEAEEDATISPDGRMAAFRRGWDLYTVDVATKKETRLTRSGNETLRNGAPDWVYPEEIGLNTGFWWSPDSKAIAFLQFDTSREPLYPHEDLLHERGIYEPERYPQAGDPNATVHLGIIPAQGGPVRWLDLGDTRDSYLIARAGWIPAAEGETAAPRVYVLRANRIQNRVELLAFDSETGRQTVIFEESDPYWINIDGGPWFLKDGRRFLWTSQRGEGYRHLFLYSNDGKQVRQLTRGPWEVTGINDVDEAAGRIFYTSDEPSHMERHLYSIGFDGGKKLQLTRESGTHNISMGPGGRFYIDTWSSLTEPPRSVLHSGDGAELGVYREPDRSAADEYDILPTEIVKFAAPDGTALWGRMIKPAGYQAGRKYPVLVRVYGGPDVELPVQNSWQGVRIDQVFAHRGYVVWQAENRGGTGRGHNFETAVYHKLGEIELADQVAGVRHLIAQGIADPGRIGIEGWSYGGFMTVNALLNASDVFKAGFAGAPVTNWMNYDTIYTERYMGLPKDNPAGYRETALPAKAKNLRGRLMLVQNFEDDNVLFQNSIQLVDALQLAGKEFEYMLYPQKTHGVSGPASRQLNQTMLDFFERWLK
jgi:dipeptidyl-peptidase-4